MKIIGYKSPIDIPSMDIEKGDLLEKHNDNKYRLVKKQFFGTSDLLPKEIVETWEPVYESDENKKNIEEILLYASKNSIKLHDNRLFKEIVIQLSEMFDVKKINK